MPHVALYSQAESWIWFKLLISHQINIDMGTEFIFLAPGLMYLEYASDLLVVVRNRDATIDSIHFKGTLSGTPCHQGNLNVL